MITNSPLQSTLNNIKVNVDSMNMRNRKTIDHLKDSIRKLERSNQSSPSSDYQRGRCLYSSANYVTSPITPKSKDSLHYNYKQIDNYNSTRNGYNYNYDYSNYTSNTQKDYNYNTVNQSNINNLTHDIDKLKLQVLDLERTKHQLEFKITEKSKMAQKPTSFEKYDQITDSEFICELQKIFGLKKKSDLLIEIKSNYDKNKIKEEFISKTINICRQMTSRKDANLIHTWRWFKRIIPEYQDYQDLKTLVKERFSISEDRNIKKSISKCINHTYSSKRKVGKIKKLLLTEPNSRNASPDSMK